MTDQEPKRITRDRVRQTSLDKDFRPIQSAVSIITQEGRQLEEDLEKIEEFDEILRETDSEK